jgi:hypothetical protein
MLNSGLYEPLYCILPSRLPRRVARVKMLVRDIVLVGGSPGMMASSKSVKITIALGICQDGF